MVLKPDLKGLVLLKIYTLFITSILYVTNFPFNLLLVSRLTRSLDCSITFTNSIVTPQGWSSRQTIGVRYESQGLYYLSVSYQISSYKDFPLTFHSQLGHLVFPTYKSLCQVYQRYLIYIISRVSWGYTLIVNFPIDSINKLRSLLH